MSLDASRDGAAGPSDQRFKRCTIVVVLAVVFGIALLGPVHTSLAGHANTLCQYSSGYYGGPSYPDQVFMAPADYINWSIWNSNLAYVARRHSGGNLNIVTYEQYWPSDLHSTNTPDGFDRFLITSMTRGGYTTAWGEMVEYSHFDCA